MNTPNDQSKKPPKHKPKNTLHVFLLAVLCVILIWSFINVTDYFAWLMLTLPSVIYGLGFLLTYKKFEFTTMAYVLIFLHLTILLIGAKYTYTMNPLFSDIQSIFNLSRNYYDRIGHLAQGFVPAILVREFFIRKHLLKPSKFLNVTVLLFVLGISASWEILEFVAALISGKPQTYILASQGDMWDTQWDMVMAVIGALIALILLSNRHNQLIQKKENASKP